MPETPAEKFTRFSFDNDFFEITAAKAPAGGKPITAPEARTEPRPPRTIKEALEQGYAEGFAAAQAQMETRVAEEISQLRTVSEKSARALEAAAAEAMEHIARSALTLLRASLHRLVGHAAENYPEQILETHLKDLAAHLSTHEELTLRIAPAARDFHEKLGLAHANIQGIGFHIKEDTGLQPTDCVAEWRRGGLEAKVADHLARLDALLVGAGASTAPLPPPTPQAAADAPPPPQAPPAASENLPDNEPPPQPTAAQETPQARATPSGNPLEDELRADDDLIDDLK